MAKNEPGETVAVIYEAPEHGTVVRYEMPGVVSVTVPFGIHKESGKQIPLDDEHAITEEPRITSLAAKTAKKVVTPTSKGVETA